MIFAKKLIRNCLICTSVYFISLNVFADTTRAPAVKVQPDVQVPTITNPCLGNFLNIIDRPSNADSVCNVASGDVEVEIGYQYSNVIHAGYQQTYPNAEFRIGVPYNTEFSLQFPNFVHQSFYPHSGFAPSIVGIKHLATYNATMQTAVEALITLPDGSTAFGNNGPGLAFNGILSYSLASEINVTLQLGASTQTESSLYNGGRYNSINPDVVFTYSPTQRIDIYAELYGSSSTGAHQGSGFNVDGGLVFLVLPNFSVDFEGGQRISGQLGSFDHYIGTGLAFQV